MRFQTVCGLTYSAAWADPSPEAGQRHVSAPPAPSCHIYNFRYMDKLGVRRYEVLSASGRKVLNKTTIGGLRVVGMEFLDQRDVLDLASLIYEAAAEPAKWKLFLEAFGQKPDAQAAAMWLKNLADDSTTDYRDEDPPPRVTGLHLEAVNFSAARGPRSPIQNHKGERVPADAPETSAIAYSECNPKGTASNDGQFNPHDLCHALIILVDKHDKLAQKLRAQLSTRGRPYTEQELGLYRLLIPPLQRAASLHRHLSRMCLPGQAALDSLDLLPTAIWLLGSMGGLIHANPAAEVVIQRGDVLTLDPDACLHARLANEDKRLTRKIQMALLPEQGLGQVPNDNRLYMGTDGAMLHVLVISLGQSLKTCGATTAAVFATDPTAMPPTLKDNLHRLYELTSAEACLASALVAGETIGRYAERTGISKETARTHLKRIMSKTGACRQVDLIRMIVSGPAFIALPAHKPTR